MKSLPLPPNLIQFPYLTLRPSSSQEPAESTNDDNHSAGVGLALAMAMHPRLGAESPAAVLSPDLLRRIWIAWALSTQQFLAAVCCRADWCIRELELCYVASGGSSSTNRIVGCESKGAPQEPFLLDPGEYIVCARGYYGGGNGTSEQVLLNQLQLVTSRGRCGPLWGQEGGRSFELLPRLPASEHDDMSVLGSAEGGDGDDGGEESTTFRGFVDWLRAMRLVGRRTDRMDMDDVVFNPARRTVEHRSRGLLVPPTRPPRLLNAQRAMLDRLDAPAPASENRVAEMTGAVGHLVSRGERAPPPSWDAELAELLGAEFAAVHARAMREDPDGLTGRLLAVVREGEGLARRLLAVVLD